MAETQALLAEYQSQVDRWDTEVKRLSREVDRGVVDPQVLLESKNQLRSSGSARRGQGNDRQSRCRADRQNPPRKNRPRSTSTWPKPIWRWPSAKRSGSRHWLAIWSCPRPFDGVVTARNANTFDFVRLPATRAPCSDLPFFRPIRPLRFMSSSGPTWFAFSSSSRARRQLCSTGQRSDRVDPGLPRPAHLGQCHAGTASGLDVTSRTLRAEIDLPNTDATPPDDLPGVVPRRFSGDLPNVKDRSFPACTPMATW